MKSSFLVVFFCFAGFMLSAQVGLSVKYQSNNSKEWNSIYENESNSNDKFISSALEYGVNYWFRLKNQRIEFLPEITYSKLSSDNLSNQQLISKAEKTTIGINLNVQIYPLDFFNDCNCPTFSKDGNILSKGFYWLLSPGLTRNSKNLFHDLPGQGSPDIIEAKSENQITAHIGIGLGLDIGVADIFTISPFALYNLSFGHEWSELNTTYGVSENETYATSSNLSQFNIGIRLMFRPDYVNQQRR